MSAEYSNYSAFYSARLRETRAGEKRKIIESPMLETCMISGDSDGDDLASESISTTLLFIQQDCEKHKPVRSTRFLKTSQPVRSETTMDSSTFESHLLLMR